MSSQIPAQLTKKLKHCYFSFGSVNNFNANLSLENSVKRVCLGGFVSKSHLVLVVTEQGGHRLHKARSRRRKILDIVRGDPSTPWGLEPVSLSSWSRSC